MEESIAKAKILIEALPYIRKFWGKTIVIKYGGAAMYDEKVKQEIMQDIVLMKYVGMNPVIVHGGGPEITRMMESMGKKVEFLDGRRITDKETMVIIEMVLVGKINQAIVTSINSHGGLAVGVSGKDGSLLKVRKFLPGGQDIGFVGEIIAVNPEIINTLDREKFIPIIAPIGVDESGDTYNINADDVAAAIALELKADKLVLLTNVNGIKDNTSQKSFSTLTLTAVEAMIKAGEITGGMLPKVRACEKALQAGIGKAHIIDGCISHALLLEIFTDQGIGTEILKEEVE